MFDIKILDIFSTFCVGLVAMVLIVLIYFLFVKFFIKDKFDDDPFIKFIKQIFEKNYSETSYAIIVTVLIYSLGIIAGDLTERMTDVDDSKQGIFQLVKTATFMESESMLRKEALFHIHGDSSLTSLGRSIFTLPDIVSTGNTLSGTNFFPPTAIHKASDLDSLWNNYRMAMTGDEKLKSDFTRFILQIYYFSKNWIYFRDSEPLHELKDLQNRIDFSRSLVLLMFGGFSITFLMWLVYLPFFFVVKYRWKCPIRFHFPIMNYMIMLALLVVCRTCYHINEMNFLKRSYGYYASHVQQDRLNEQKSKSYLNFYLHKEE